MQANQNLAAKRLDLSARSIDLLSVIAKSTGSLTDVARDIISWRGREGLSEGQLTFALDSAKDFAQPNTNGEIVLANLETTASRLYGLQMVMPGAIGRAILADPSLSWLATTQAVLLKYHDLEYSSKALCDLALASLIGSDDHRRSAYLARMYPVMAKLVESIALHSTNSGYGVSDLPESLRELPRHFQDAGEFSRSIHAIQGAYQQQLLVQMDYCVTGLLDWILNHWQGCVTVSYCNKIVYEASLGNQTNRLLFVVTKNCLAGMNCFASGHVGEIKIAIAVDARSTWNDMQNIYTGKTDPLDGQSARNYRSDLYDIRLSNGNEYSKLTKKEEICAKKNAQEILRSITNLRVLPFHHNSMRLGFKIQVQHHAGQTFRWWLLKAPSLLQANFGSVAAPRQLWTETSQAVGEVAQMEENDAESIGLGTTNSGKDRYSLKRLRKLYPEVEEVMTMAKSRCGCGCEGLLSQYDQYGCLQTTATTYLLLLIGHGLADATGLPNVSNLRGHVSERSLCEATITILVGIARPGEIRWRDWFKLAASAATGLTHDLVDDFASKDNGGELIGWTCGSMTVVPLWLQLDRTIELQNSWGVKVLQGKPSTLEPDIAVIESQLTNGAKPAGIPRQQEMRSLAHDNVIDGEVQLEAFSSIIAGTKELYRMMTLISTSSSMRVLDPADIYKGHMHALRPSCNHKSQPQQAVLWSIDEIMQNWLGHRPGKIPPYDHGIPVYLTDGYGLKVNVAVGLSHGRCVLHSEDCCFKCLITAARGSKGAVISGKGGQTHTRQILKHAGNKK